MVVNLSVLENYLGQLGFAGQRRTPEEVSLEGARGRAEAKSEATFGKLRLGSLVFTQPLLFQR